MSQIIITIVFCNYFHDIWMNFNLKLYIYEYDQWRQSQANYFKNLEHKYIFNFYQCLFIICVKCLRFKYKCHNFLFTKILTLTFNPNSESSSSRTLQLKSKCFSPIHRISASVLTPSPSFPFLSLFPRNLGNNFDSRNILTCYLAKQNITPLFHRLECIITSQEQFDM